MSEKEVIDKISDILFPYSSKCYNHMIYTLKHKIAIISLSYEYLGHISNRLMLHDTEKLVLYEHMDTKTAHHYHSDFSVHHYKYISNLDIVNQESLIECVLDYESARYTKPDKPLNAKATIMKYYPDLYDKVQPILKKFGIDSETNNDCNFENWNKVKDSIYPFFVKLNIDMILKLKNSFNVNNIENFLNCYNDEILKI